MLSFGAFSVVVTGGLSQSAVQLGSPPPLTEATLVTLAPAAAVGVTFTVKLVLAPTARPAGIAQLTSWPAIVQPTAVLMVRPAGIVSVTFDTAVVAAVLGTAASAFFFYPPLYTFWVSDPQEVVNLVLYLIVAIVTGHLATQLRTQAHLAQKREIEMARAEQIALIAAPRPMFVRELARRRPQR